MIVGVVPTAIGPWIEQHCVAILSSAYDIDHSKDDDLIYRPTPGHLITPKGIEHVPEVALKLRCTAER